MSRFKILRGIGAPPKDPNRCRMKVFEDGDKVNFVDENNVFVGYDLSQSCCETASYFFSKEKPIKIIEKPEDTQKYFQEFNIKDFVFDRNFFEKDVLEIYEGGSALFRLLNYDTSEDLYLCLYNCHNGYYAHGFEMKIGEEIIQSDSLSTTTGTRPVACD